MIKMLNNLVNYLWTYNLDCLDSYDLNTGRPKTGGENPDLSQTGLLTVRFIEWVLCHLNCWTVWNQKPFSNEKRKTNKSSKSVQILNNS